MTDSQIIKTLALIPGLFVLDRAHREATQEILREHYKLPEDFTCIAENVLAEQFVAMTDGSILKVSMESGEMEAISGSLCQLQAALTTHEDANYLLANSLARDWEACNKKKLTKDFRLLPIQPFIAGGAFEASNVYAEKRKVAINYLFELYAQIKDLPDGATIALKVVP